MNSRYGGLRYLIVVAAVVFIGIIAVQPTLKITRSALQVYLSCTLGHSIVDPLCYSDHIVALYPSLSVTEIFAVIRSLQQYDNEFVSCHLIAHELGAHIVAAQPETWFEAIADDPPDAPCDGGFLHGVLKARLQGAQAKNDEPKIIDELQKACEPPLGGAMTPLRMYECWHGLGHVYLYLSNGNVKAALERCREAVPSAITIGPRICYNGVFMEAFNDHEAGEPNLELLPAQIHNLTYVERWCSTFTDSLERATCLQRGSVLQEKNFRDDPNGIASFCSKMPPGEEEYCARRIYHNLAYDALTSGNSVGSACGQLSSTSTCYATQALTAYIVSGLRGSARVHAAASVCHEAPKDSQATCRMSLAEAGSFFYASSSQEFDAYCSHFSGIEKARCRASSDTVHFWALGE